MKFLSFLILAILVFNSSNGQNNNWTSVTYTHSNGPVSPEYQYSYTIEINNEGTGVISYRKNTTIQQENFSVGRKGMQMLRSAINKSNVLNINPDSLKSNRTLMGGSENKMLITFWQAPNLDQKPPTLEIPNQINPKYSPGIYDLYYTVEMLVPPSVWNKVSK